MKIPHKIVIGCALGVGLYVAIYIHALNSEAFKFAKHTLAASPSIHRIFGEPVEINLSIFGSFKEKYVNADQTVSMTINVAGPIKSDKVAVKLSRVSGGWAVSSVEVGGQPISLD